MPPSSTDPAPAQWCVGKCTARFFHASGRGDYRRKESLAHIRCRVAGPILVNLLLCPVREHMIDVRMTQCPIQRRVSSVAMEVMNPRNINAQPTADAAAYKKWIGNDASVCTEQAVQSQSSSKSNFALNSPAG